MSEVAGRRSRDLLVSETSLRKRQTKRKRPLLPERGSCSVTASPRSLLAKCSQVPQPRPPSTFHQFRIAINKCKHTILSI